jgi:hypothetical protein
MSLLRRSKRGQVFFDPYAETLAIAIRAKDWTKARELIARGEGVKYAFKNRCYRIADIAMNTFNLAALREAPNDILEQLLTAYRVDENEEVIAKVLINSFDLVNTQEGEGCERCCAKLIQLGAYRGDCFTFVLSSILLSNPKKWVYSLLGYFSEKDLSRALYDVIMWYEDDTFILSMPLLKLFRSLMKYGATTDTFISRFFRWETSLHAIKRNMGGGPADFDHEAYVRLYDDILHLGSFIVLMYANMFAPNVVKLPKDIWVMLKPFLLI